MKSTKMILLLFTTMILIPAVCDSSPAFSAQADNTVYTWRIGSGTGGTTDNPPILFMHKVKELAEERSGGRLSVQLYPGNTLGNNSELPQGVLDGTVDSAILPTQFFTAIVPDLFIFDISNMYDDPDVLLDILINNETIAKKKAAEKGCIIATYLKLFPRWTITTKKMTTINDFRGKKLWHATSRMISQKGQLLGVTSANFAGPDVAPSLQNGTIDGAWCDSSFMNNYALYDFAKYVLKSPGEPMMSLFCISSIWFNKLPDDLKSIVMEVAREAAPPAHAQTDKMTAQYIENLVNKGCEVIDPDDAFKTALGQAVAGEAEWLFSNYPEVKPAYEEMVLLLTKYKE
jgi:TRAP-type C4-dicarboxylate transport system substrate-binding protein